ncbi:hypothetical protein BC937DRAFT_87433 [Endogone sp. FLAS-F59071]|nr:hypothetical protein BC937DRAFT_87433 [Endogone sp. FLAS-F59071]|eukprot:RUS19458.1 hypothetical protein BC937DRAFT_87433 [Endogone sp. FLAS-F59071]
MNVLRSKIVLQLSLSAVSLLLRQPSLSAISLLRRPISISSKRNQEEQNHTLNPISRLFKTIRRLEFEKEKSVLKEKIEREMFNVKGAIEYIKWNLTPSVPMEKIKFQIKEPIDRDLKALSEDKKFKNIVKEACIKNDQQLDDVKRCIGGLYHQASCDAHEHEAGVVIDKATWNMNEVLALGVLFKYYTIPFEYRDGRLVDFP